MTQTLVKTCADFSTTLTSKTSIGATTATLTSGIDSDGIQLPTGVYGFTIDRNNTQKEHFTATLTGDALTDIKTVTRGTGVGTAGFVRTHRKGAEIVITDHVALKRMMNVLDGTTSFDSATPLGYDGTATISTANQFATKTYVDGVAIAGGANSSLTIKGISKLSLDPVSATEPIAVGTNDTRVPTQDENDAMIGTSGTPSSSNKYVTNADTIGTGSVLRGVLKFGGTGADGVLNVTSGTTTIDLASANFVTKNYTSINISVGATLAFSNPAVGGTVIQLKSQEAVTIAGTINASGCGTAGGAGGVYSGGVVVGVTGTSIATSLMPVTGGGSAGVGGFVGGFGGPAGTATTSPYFYTPSVNSLNQGMGKVIVPGTGGGGGSSGNTPGTGGVGGRGGGAIYIECGGAWNFTGTINVSGVAGSDGITGGGGGGGGSCGMLFALYNSLTASSGTVTNNSGAGGTGSSSNAYGGGGGNIKLGSGGIGANSSGAGQAGALGAGGGGGAFNGAAGGASSTDSSLSLITQNYYF